jgi:hypothetical protein
MSTARRVVSVLSRLIVIAVVTAAVTTIASAGPMAHAADFVAVPTVVSGSSPDGLGRWAVHYQHVEGGDAAVGADINDRLDFEANRLVQQATWDGSTKRPWTYDANGMLFFGPMTVSELFTGQYNTDEPHMPIQSLSSIVCDGRSGAPITWDSLFLDKAAGLARLGDATEAALISAAPADHVRDWRRQGQFAPLDMNFRAWIPTANGIELHFPEFQFGRGLKVITVPWAKLADQIRPEFTPMMG